MTNTEQRVKTKTDRVRFVKSYTNHVGKAFMRFSLDGAETLPGVVDVCVRASRQGVWEYTRREAREVARERFTASGLV